MAEKVHRTAFICTGNSARSILAEAILRRLGRGRFVALSAGSHPSGQVHPLALEVLQEYGYDTQSLRSKSWDELAIAGSPHLDFVFTVCDQAAGEACPVWPGQPMTAHWGLPDPAALRGSVTEQRAAFRQTLVILERRIELFTALPLEALERLALRARLDEIGRFDARVDGRRPDPSRPLGPGPVPE